MVGDKMVIKFDDQGQFPLDAKKDGVIVMPVNLQGLLEFGKESRRFKHEFPITSKQYLKDCINGEIFVGDIKEYKENGFTIVMLFYKNYELDLSKENDIKLDFQMGQCLNKLFDNYPEHTKFYSPVIKYVNSQMKIVHNNKKYQWIVLKDK